MNTSASNCNIYCDTIINYLVEAIRGAEAQSVTISATGCGFDPLEEMKYLLKLVFSLSYQCRGKAWCWVPPLNTHGLHSSAESGERSALNLSSICYVKCEPIFQYNQLACKQLGHIFYIRREMKNFLLWLYSDAKIHTRINSTDLHFVWRLS